MADEFDNEVLDQGVDNNNNNNNNNDAGVDNQQQQPKTPKTTDDILDDFAARTDREPRTTTQDQNNQQQPPKGQQTQQRQQGQLDNRGQQTGQRQQDPNQNRQAEQVPTPSRKYGRLFFQDGQGNIYNAKGEQIAAKGYGHSVFRKIYPHIEHMENENARLNTQLQAIEKANEAAKQAGLSLDEVAAAQSLMVAYKRDAKAAIKFLLHQASERGIDTSDITQGAGIDMSALRTSVQETVQQIVTEALKPFAPLVTQVQQQQEQTELAHEAKQIYDEFIEKYPDAQNHGDEIAAVMRARNDQGVPTTITEAYFQLRTFCAENNIKWNQPLKPQIAALKQRGTNHGSNGQNNQPLPDFNGRSGNDVVTNDRNLADANESWDNIINLAVAQASQVRT